MSTSIYFRGRTGSRCGQTLILVTLNLLFLFAVAGLAIDLGMAYSKKGMVQVQADAAASGAAATAVNNGDSCSTLTCGTAYACTASSLPTTINAGCYYAEQNGAAAANVSILANNTSVNGVSPAMWLKATVTQTQSNSFLLLANFSNATIAASATAGVNTLQQAACIYALGSTTGTTGPSGLTASGSSIITTSSCGVYVNATGTSASRYPAISLPGSARLTASGTGSKIYSGAGAGLAGVSLGGGASISPSPTAGTVTDPLSWLPKPPVASSCSPANTNYAVSGSATYNPGPGTYCGGMSITGNVTVNLSTGVYVMNGGGFTVANSAKVNGTGVMIYLTKTSTESVAAAPVSITGNPVVNLSALTTGPWRGIAFFQDSSNSYSGTNTIANSSTATITGSYYFPNTNFSFTGNTSTALNSAFVANTIAVTGSSTLDNDTTGKYTGLTKSSSFLIQ